MKVALPFILLGLLILNSVGNRSTIRKKHLSIKEVLFSNKPPFLFSWKDGFQAWVSIEHHYPPEEVDSKADEFVMAIKRVIMPKEKVLPANTSIFVSECYPPVKIQDGKLQILWTAPKFGNRFPKTEKLLLPLVRKENPSKIDRLLHQAEVLGKSLFKMDSFVSPSFEQEAIRKIRSRISFVKGRIGDPNKERLVITILERVVQDSITRSAIRRDDADLSIFSAYQGLIHACQLLISAIEDGQSTSEK